MSDLDLLRRLGEQIVPPPFDDLRDTARRRTRRSIVGATIAVATTATVLVGIAHGTVIDRGSPPPITHLPSTVTPTTGDHTTDAPHGPAPARPLTYAVGATLHYGDRTVTLPDRAVELDVTDAGVVVRTADDLVWFTDGADPEQIGDAGGSDWGEDASDGGDVLWGSYVGHVVSSNSGPEVAWYEFPHPRSPEAVVYDTARGEVIDRYPYQLVEDAGVVNAVSGLYSVDATAVYGFTDLTYGEDIHPTWRIDLVSRTAEPLYEPEAYQAILQNRGLARTLLTSDRTEDPSDFVPFDGLLELSVVGDQVTPAGDEPKFVRDGLTGRDFEFSAPPNYPATDSLWLVQWRDDDTVLLYADQGDRADLLECHVATGTCAVTVQVPPNAIVPEIG